MTEKVIDIREDATREVVLLELDDLIDNPKNPRKHTDALIQSLSRQFLKGVGYRDPIEVDELNMILAGHGRKKALMAVRQTGKLSEVRGLVGGQIPVIRYLDLNEVEKLAYLLAANKEQEKSEWDTLKLKDLLTNDPIGLELKADDIRLSGFTDSGLSRLFLGLAGEEVEGQEEKPKESPLPEEEMKMEFWEWLRSKTEIFSLFSGGKDSMAMLGELLDNSVPREKITLVHIATPLDYPGLTEFCQAFAEQVGVKFLRLGLTLDDDERWEMIRAFGFPRMYPKWCTNVFKIQHKKKWLTAEGLRDRDDVVMCLGWRDEESEYRTKALKRAFWHIHRIRVARPIKEMTEGEVWAKIEQHEWQAHACYECRGRLSCVFCGAITRDEWKTIRENDPVSFHFALRVLAEGVCADNIDVLTIKNTIRKLMGLGTVGEARAHDQKKGSKWLNKTNYYKE